MSMEDVVALIDAREAAPKKRGPYKTAASDFTLRHCRKANIR
jgi:hypothetical protein